MALATAAVQSSQGQTSKDACPCPTSSRIGGSVQNGQDRLAEAIGALGALLAEPDQHDDGAHQWDQNHQIPPTGAVDIVQTPRRRR